MSKTITTGKRYRKDDIWHDANGPIPDNPLDWDPPMTDEEITAAALADPDCPPLTDAQLARMRRVSPAKFVRQKLGMSREQFADAYGIPLDTLTAWERHEAAPTPAELAFIQAIAGAPDAVRKALAKEPAE